MYGGGADGFGSDAGVSQFAGGGFMPPSADTAGGPFSPGGSKTSRNTSSGLTPITFRQVSRAMAGDDQLQIDGQPVSTVTAVARILSKELRATDARFTVDDGTGTVSVKHWLDAETQDEKESLASLLPNTYVRIHGQFRSFGGKPELQAFSIKPIVDYNEVTFHQLECIFVHVSNTKGQGAVGATQPGGSTTTNTNSVYQPNQYNSQYGAGGSTGGGSIGDLQTKVLGIYESPKIIVLEAGLAYTEAASMISGFTKEQVKEAIDFLVNEGHLYSTIDDVHYKSTIG